MDFRIRNVDFCSGIDGCSIAENSVNFAWRSSVGFIDDEDIRAAEVYVAWVVGKLITSSMRICDGYPQIRFIEGGVVIAT